MRQITRDELAAEIAAHREWLCGTGGHRANLSGSDLSGADLSRANLGGADLYGANLSRANLYGADLSGANLGRANLGCANLGGADLGGANLSRANLYGADLIRADLYGADLSRANLGGANLGGARGVRHASVGWSGHGECGRTLLACVIGSDVVLFCGCFRGSVSELEQYIANGHERLRASRTLALRIVLALLIFGGQP